MRNDVLWGTEVSPSMSRGVPDDCGSARTEIFGGSIDAPVMRRKACLASARHSSWRGFAHGQQRNVAAPAAFSLRRYPMVDNSTVPEQRRSTRRAFLWGGGGVLLVLCAVILVWVFVFVPQGGPGRNGAPHGSASTGILSNEGSGQSAAAKNNAVAPQTSEKVGAGQNSPGAAAQIERTAEPLKLTDQQRQKIRDFFANQKADRTGSVNFTLAIGSAVPQNVPLQKLPPQVSSALGGYNADQYILVGNQLVIVEPNARRVVAIVPGVG
jgi:hypothetical protein